MKSHFLWLLRHVKFYVVSDVSEDVDTFSFDPKMAGANISETPLLCINLYSIKISEDLNIS